MKIVLASSEAVPFSKTGGLADVSTALSKALASRGHEVTLIIPYYDQIQEKVQGQIAPVTPTGYKLQVPVGQKYVRGQILHTCLPGSRVRVLQIEQPEYFGRPGLYQYEGKDYGDNCERFSFFGRSVMETIRLLRLAPDVIHANDWQTGLIPALLRVEYQCRPGFRETASVITLHNMAFIGQFWHWDMLLTGLDWKYFNWKQMEFFGHLSLLKTGIVFADQITTVSPTYSREIQTPDFGYGMNGVLLGRQEDLAGILNGVDHDVWSPLIDPLIAQRYSTDDVAEGKAACKQALQERVNLPTDPEVPLIGMVSRMTDQKGFDIIEGVLKKLLSKGVQMVFLGSGDARFEDLVRKAAEEHPDQVAVTIGFDDSLAHQIEAGADIYLMPSAFEPCGLNQMYSLVYGTVPVVHAVGGLADSVVDASDENLANGTANGFSFTEYDSGALWGALKRALKAFKRKEIWSQLQRRGMSQDWSWNRSAREYESVYQRAIDKRKAALAAEPDEVEEVQTPVQVRNTSDKS